MIETFTAAITAALFRSDRAIEYPKDRQTPGENVGRSPAFIWREPARRAGILASHIKFQKLTEVLDTAHILCRPYPTPAI